MDTKKTLKYILNKLKKILKYKFRMILFLLMTLAIFLGYLIINCIFFDDNLFELDFEKKSYLLASLGIITSALIASFSMLSNYETNNNKEEYKNLKYMLFQLDTLDEYINYSITWVNKFSNDEKEVLRLNEFFNTIYKIKKEILSRDLIFTYNRGVQDYGLARVIVCIDELYHYKNSYGITEETNCDLKDSLSGLSLTLMMVKSKVSDKLDIYEQDSI